MATDWHIDSLDTQSVLSALFNQGLTPLPPKQRKIGHSVVRWWEGRTGEAVIMASGGSMEDRTLAEQIVKADLEANGYRRAQFTFDASKELRKTAAWTDIVNKAKRLIQSGNVKVLNNTYNNLVGHVIGDHGEYNVEIGRDDPASRSITTWKCECPWDQYAWQRTRKWKYLEGRPCSHVMALYWKGLATPLDDDPFGTSPMDMQGTGQKGPAPGLLPEPSPAPAPAPDLPRSFGPDGEILDQPSEPPVAPAAQPPEADPAYAPPASPNVLPPAPADLAMPPPPPPPPGMNPPGFPAPPNSVSVPGARIPTPFNPIQYPGGTYSRVSADATFEPGEIIRLKAPAFGMAEGRSEAHGSGQYREVPEGSTGEVIGQDATTGFIDAIFPLDDSGPMEPYHVRCFLEPADVAKTRIRPPGPFIKRR